MVARIVEMMESKFNISRNGIVIILVQVLFICLVLVVLYFLYPNVDVSVSGDFVKFYSDDDSIIEISMTEDFSDPRYLDMANFSNVSFDLEPGTYYWRSYNGLIKGRINQFTIESVVGLGIEGEGNDTNLINIGNVRLNVTKNKDGQMIGRIILDVEGGVNIENEGEEYIGGQI